MNPEEKEKRERGGGGIRITSETKDKHSGTEFEGRPINR